ncbi:MAG TPA: phage portal protein [Steroidobacteraceae bacterium]|nr:phage portal protein [Steroidobacteraceae bacterium]
MTPRSFLSSAFDVLDEVALPALARAAKIVDEVVAVAAPAAARDRQLARQQRNVLGAWSGGYEATEPSRRRRFHRDTRNGDALARSSAVALRNQARHLDRNVDIVRGGFDKLTDFIVGAQGITVEPQPKRMDGTVHDEFAAQLRRDYEAHRQWPEVTWTHNGGGMDRIVCRTWLRDGECLGQLVSGPRKDLTYGSDVPVAIELIEPDLLPHWLDDAGKNIHQAIERSDWGRPVAYHLLKSHPGSDTVAGTGQTKRVPAERMLHLRSVDRIGQLRGVTILASTIPTLQDIHEYRGFEQIAAKMASSMVLKIKRGDPGQFNGADVNGNPTYDPKNPPVYQMDGGMIVFSGAAGEDAEFFDTKRPNAGAAPWIQQQLRFASAGFGGLSYSAFARDYNGTYSAQRQELVENWPHYHALTGEFVGQWSRPSYEEFVRWRVLSKGIPADVDPASIFEALFFGPAMPWIDPEKEANAQLILVQACFKSSSQVIRERGGSLSETYHQLKAEKTLRSDLQIGSTVEVAPSAVSQAKPSLPEAPPLPAGVSARVVPIRRQSEEA